MYVYVSGSFYFNFNCLLFSYTKNNYCIFFHKYYLFQSIHFIAVNDLGREEVIVFSDTVTVGLLMLQLIASYTFSWDLMWLSSAGPKRKKLKTKDIEAG